MSYPHYVPNPSIPSPASQASGYPPIGREVPVVPRAQQYNNYPPYQSPYQPVPPSGYYQECQQPTTQQRQVRELPVLQKEPHQPPQKPAEQFLPPTALATATPVTDSIRDEPPPLDYQLLLISLAEDYFAAAHRQGSLVALSMRIEDLDRYYKLIASGLGCLETVLKVGRGIFSEPLAILTVNSNGGCSRDLRRL
jgi:Cohesin loading factor